MTETIILSVKSYKDDDNTYAINRLESTLYPFESKILLEEIKKKKKIILNSFENYRMYIQNNKTFTNLKVWFFGRTA